MDLRAIGSALNAQLTPRSKDSDEEGKSPKWMKRQSDGIDGVVQGVFLAGTSALLGVVLALFSNNPAWVLIWLVFCAWLTVWGAIEIGAGISSLIQSRLMRRGMDRLAGDAITPELPSAPDTQDMPESPVAQEESAPLSVTEQTTTPLKNPGSHR